MNAHDVASVVVAFASIEYAHQKLFRALQRHTRRILHSFSPLQLARVTYGFGSSGVDDEVLFRVLCEQVLKQRHLLHAKNIVEIIAGLSEAEYTPQKVLQSLIGDASHLVRWIGAEDAIQLLHALSKLPPEKLSDVSLSQAPDRLIGVVRHRAQGWWRFRPQDMADLFEASQVFGCLDDALLETSCRQFNRIFKVVADDYRMFLRLWGSLAELSLKHLAVVRGWIQRKQPLQLIIEERLVDTLLEVDGDRKCSGAPIKVDSSS
jgi:hypothetical protein